MGRPIIPVEKREQAVLACARHVTLLSIYRMTGLTFTQINGILRKHGITIE